MGSDFWRRRLQNLKLVFKSAPYRKVLLIRIGLTILNRLLPKVQSLVIRDQGMDLLYDVRDRTITLYALALGNFHFGELKQVVDRLQGEGFGLGGLFLEIGGNIGSSTVSALHSGQFSYAHVFEPLPSNVEFIQRNVALNGFESCCEIVPKALSNQVGSSQMRVCEYNRGDNRVVNADKATPTATSYGEQYWQEIEIQTDTLDHYLQEKQIDPASISLIWMDTQGFEGFVLQGARQFLAARQVPICTEFWPYGLREAGCVSEFTEFVEEYFSAFLVIGDEKKYASKEIRQLLNTIPGVEHRDLILLP